MIETDDHPAAPPHRPQPARPILAFDLLAVEEEQRRRFAEQGQGTTIRTGCAELDEGVLGGGFERGIVVGISGEGIEGRLISLNLLVSVLLSHLPHTTTKQTSTNPIASIIDTTGSFPISLLAAIIRSRLLSTQNSGVSRNRNHVTRGDHHEARTRQNDHDHGIGEIDVEEETRRCLEMVAVSRVFDIEGLWEVLGEVGRGSDDVGDLGAGVEDSRAGMEGKGGAERKGGAEEKEGERGNETTFIEDTRHSAEARSRGDGAEIDDHGTEMIIIDSMTHIINELFSRKERSESHTLLTLLSQSLHSLSSTSNTLTILHNGTVPSSAKSNHHHHHHHQPPQPAFKYHPPPLNYHNSTSAASNPSIFAGNRVKPALGRIFDDAVALHLFLSDVPRGRVDAEILYGGGGADGLEGGAKEKITGVQYCTVVEVIKDQAPILGEIDSTTTTTTTAAEGKRREGGTGRKFGWREQRWCALVVEGGGLGLVGAFPSL